MNIFDTFVFSTVASFFQAFWSDSVGKVFLTTALTYSISYMLYSSYFSWFTGGYGGILLSQTGFTAADFLSLFPTSLLLLFVSIRYLIKTLLKFALIYIVIPLVIVFLAFSAGLVGVLATPNQTATYNTIGILVYLIGIGLEGASIKWMKDKPAIPIIISYAGVIFAVLTISTTVMTPTPISNPQSIVSIFLNEIMAMMILIYTFAAPSLIGLRLASFTAKKKLLSRVTGLILKQPIQVAGLSIQKTTKQRNLRDYEGSIFSYKTNSEKPIFLISSFARVTAIYLPPETIEAEYGRMHLLANDLICSIEVEGRNKEDEGVL